MSCLGVCYVNDPKNGGIRRPRLRLIERGNVAPAPLFPTTVLGFSWFWWMWDSYSGVQDSISCVLLRVPPSEGTLLVNHTCTYP